MIGAPWAHFDPTAFDVGSLEHAKQATVGDLDFLDGEIHRSQDRWEEDTNYTIDFITDHLPISSASSIIDYGCGTGRISKGLIERFNCLAFGVDASDSMLGVAAAYVNSLRFSAHSSDSPYYQRRQCDVAVCLWVLQHSPTPSDDAVRIRQSMKPGGRLLVFNENLRFVPTVEYGFANDGVDVTAELTAVFGAPLTVGRLDPCRVARKFSERSFWAIYECPLDL